MESGLFVIEDDDMAGGAAVYEREISFEAQEAQAKADAEANLAKARAEGKIE